MPNEYSRPSGTKGPCRLNEILRFQRKNLTPDKTRKSVPSREAEDDYEDGKRCITPGRAAS